MKNQEIADLCVSDFMTLDPETITPDATLRDVIELMKVEGCRQLPVVDNDQLVGIVTDRDVRLAVNSPIVLHERWQDELLLDSVTVDSCMTPNPATVTPESPLYQVASILSLYKFGALPVVEDGVLVGIISVTDFLDWFAEKQPEMVVSD